MILQEKDKVSVHMIMNLIFYITVTVKLAFIKSRGCEEPHRLTVLCFWDVWISDEGPSKFGASSAKRRHS